VLPIGDRDANLYQFSGTRPSRVTRLVDDDRSSTLRWGYTRGYDFLGLMVD
jgi:hypothetical protein